MTIDSIFQNEHVQQGLQSLILFVLTGIYRTLRRLERAIAVQKTKVAVLDAKVERLETDYLRQPKRR